MKVDRDSLLWFMNNIRRRNEGKELTDKALVDELAHYMEANPSCIDPNGISDEGRYSYSCVGYGVFSLFGEKYRMGRIEVYDKYEDSGYAVHEGVYSLPWNVVGKFEDFIESIQTELPINIEIGSHEWCSQECAKSLGFENEEEMRDPKKIEEYRHKKNDKYAQENGYENWEDFLSNCEFLKSK